MTCRDILTILPFCFLVSCANEETKWEGITAVQLQEDKEHVLGNAPFQNRLEGQLLFLLNRGYNEVLCFHNETGEAVGKIEATDLPWEKMYNACALRDTAIIRLDSIKDKKELRSRVQIEQIETSPEKLYMITSISTPKRMIWDTLGLATVYFRDYFFLSFPLMDLRNPEVRLIDTDGFTDKIGFSFFSQFYIDEHYMLTPLNIIPQRLDNDTIPCYSLFRLKESCFELIDLITTVPDSLDPMQLVEGLIATELFKCDDQLLLGSIGKIMPLDQVNEEYVLHEAKFNSRRYKALKHTGRTILADGFYVKNDKTYDLAIYDSDLDSLQCLIQFGRDTVGCPILTNSGFEIITKDDSSYTLCTYKLSD